MEPKLRAECFYERFAVGERDMRGEVVSGRNGGVHTSANAGMSSVRHVSKRAHRMAEGSYGRFIHVGLVGPKPRRKRVGDGQTVYIPLPFADDTSARCGVG